MDVKLTGKKVFLPNLCVVFTLPMLTYSNIRSASACEHFLTLNKNLLFSSEFVPFLVLSIKS